MQRLDYGNATLAGIPYHLIKRMQSVLNSAARLVFSASRYGRITSLLTQLHWLKVPERIKFKLAVLVYTRQLRRALLGNSISYLLTRLVSVSALLRHHRLLSDAPIFQPSAIDFFSVAAARLWNTMPLNITSALGIVNICIQETYEDPSLLSLFP